jgi:hypothetical protein
MKKILLSVLSIGIVATVAVYASQAFFSDKETSTGNRFSAGAIDLKIDYTGYYNTKVGEGNPLVHWDLKDLVAEKFFDFADVKPGDFGEGTLSFHVYNNPAWACVSVKNLTNNENGCTEPEGLPEGTDTTCDNPGLGQGELASHLYFTAWEDVNGNNIWEAGEPLLFSNKMGPASDVLDGVTYPIADSTTGTGPILASTTRYIGIKWCFGAMEVNESTHVIACNGSGEGNITQTDSLTADVEFYVEQSRNNPSFRCVKETHELILENKDNEYNRLTSDGRYAVLTWAGDGDTFNYSLKAYGLVPSKEYSLLYYADGWPGNHPGYWFKNAFADPGTGNLTMSGNPDLLMDLPKSPDTNVAGAKIWLIPSADYNSVNFSVLTWPFANDWLFESNLIQYNDTNN